jgi:hypothetical protein
MNGITSQCRYLLTLAEPILDGLDDSHRTIEPIAGAKTAGWLVGHLAVSGDFARRLCGRSSLCPESWHTSFNPGSMPQTDETAYPLMQALKDTFFIVYRDLCEISSQVPGDLLAEPNPFTPARDHFTTAGDFLGYLMSAHLAYHLGQLVGWRAAAGLGRLRRSASQAA